MDNFKTTVSKVTKTVTKTSGDLVKSARVSMAINSIEEKIKRAQTEMGVKLHGLYKNGDAANAFASKENIEFFDGKYTEIVELEIKLSEFKIKRELIKGKKLCPNCGSIEKNEADFCSKCGDALAENSQSSVSDASEDEGIDIDGMIDSDVMNHTGSVFDGLSDEEIIGKFLRSENKDDNQQQGDQNQSVSCRLCGAKNDKSEKFCVSCGRMIY